MSIHSGPNPTWQSSASLDPKQIHAKRFYLTAEMLSPSDRPHLIRAKLDFYRSHPENRTILLIR